MNRSLSLAVAGVTARVRQTVFSLVGVIVVAASFASGPNATASPLLYSVDHDADVLVTIDPDTGAVTEVGSLGRDVLGIDLAMLNGQLYAVETVFVEQRAELLHLDQLTGTATTLGNLVAGTSSVTLAEGLTAVGSQLRVGFTVAANSPFSSRIGDLSLSGTITNDTDVGVDMDGLGTSAGQVYAVDVDPAPALNMLYTIQPTGHVGSYSNTGRGALNDIVFANGSLYGISSVDGGNVQLIDASDGSLISLTSLNRAGSYSGLAVVPEPTTAGLLGTAGLLVLLRRTSVPSSRRSGRTS